MLLCYNVTVATMKLKRKKKKKDLPENNLIIKKIMWRGRCLGGGNHFYPEIISYATKRNSVILLKIKRNSWRNILNKIFNQISIIRMWPIAIRLFQFWKILFYDFICNILLKLCKYSPTHRNYLRFIDAILNLKKYLIILGL